MSTMRTVQQVVEEQVWAESADDASDDDVGRAINAMSNHVLLAYISDAIYELYTEITPDETN